jgi:multisubunit Na+/H+ antiporter MnhB subunit
MLIMFASYWLIFIGMLFISIYIMYDKHKLFRSIGDFFIAFSFVKRTKTILISYGFLFIFIGVMMILITIAKRSLN